MRFPVGWFAIALLTASPCLAGLNGRSVTIDRRYPLTSTLLGPSTSTTVGSSFEFDDGIVRIDVADSLITLTSRTVNQFQILIPPQNFNGYRIHFPTPPGFVSVVEDSADGLEAVALFNDPNAIWIDYAGVLTVPGDYDQLKVTLTQHTPEPLCLCVLLLFLAPRRARAT
jgi:hypothetical protein